MNDDPSRTLALFDLDHTLIPFDSAMAWTHHLVERGLLPAQADANYLDACRAYVAGTLDIRGLHRAAVGPIAGVARARLAQWQRAFEAAMAARIPPAAMALVQRHQRDGHLCTIVTATSGLIAAPFARLFGVGQLIATHSASVDGTAQGALTGEVDGEPCAGEHKLAQVDAWLVSRAAAQRRLADFERSWFYSDSIGDLPLLGAVTDPVAVDPDEKLRAHASACGWPILALR